MADQTASWEIDKGQLPEAATFEPATVEDVGGQMQLKMSRKELDIYNNYTDIDANLNIALDLLAVLCNSCILKVTHSRRPLSVPQVYIAAIASCDLLVGVFAGIGETLNKMRCTPEWTRVICVHIFWPLFGISVGFAMSASLIAMYLSVDRLIALKFPLQYHIMSSPRTAKVLVISTIILNQILTINYPLRLEVWPRLEDDQSMDIGHSRYTALGLMPVLRKVCFAVEFALRFALPLLVMLASNTWTLYCIAVNNRKRRNLAANSNAPQKTKYLAVTMGVVTIFFITQSVRIAFLLDTLIFTNQHRGLFITEMVEVLGRFLAKVNSVVNIFIYLVLDQQFRQEFIKLVKCSKLETVKPNAPSTSIGLQKTTENAI